ncbi:Rab family GTPase [Entamoeba histolytica HM-1:IMSS-B]|uniref:Rab family GTPase n=8 Tax=Entamoeba TaxID=5758 RepID=A0A8U0WQ01_ENTH1|nr:Rab family GTPase [Entamoeba nuttalli P19]XP_651513.1 Rab family GTPase [Entamoeba histolytica HM-1:IMSS]EMD45698.1 small GTPase EhRabF2, putative [Entamoeba histolytica KU27]EMH77045.1 Rab family GTPase [Entamoeba histolytica HM-1:IMSS-B]EMS14705.1 small GTPase EhRabF2, putative [Entamoeba histolytica HM-3:IMSS]ENY62352.1 small GTPase EhRabF2, putative [Entamoeba histolytica HM-1:IMSS-A]BAD82832.1 small GTPase EhRabF2 [Entamoeba histolytica]|eukprot:XP_008859736.1 Rab family GTPase [Entamoeba nuttalli P19]
MLNGSMKICVIGDMSVGKTCISNRLIKDQFIDEEKATIAASFVTTKLESEGKEVDVSIWDTAGQEKYRSMVSMYYRGSSGAVIVYDITSKTSFEHIRGWYKDLKDAVPDVAVAVVGNKSDINDQRVINEDEIKRLNEELKIEVYAEVSAKTGENVKKVFLDLLKFMKPKERSEVTCIEHHQIQEKDEESTSCC